MYLRVMCACMTRSMQMYDNMERDVLLSWLVGSWYHIFIIYHNVLQVWLWQNPGDWYKINHQIIIIGPIIKSLLCSHAPWVKLFYRHPINKYSSLVNCVTCVSYVYEESQYVYAYVMLQFICTIMWLITVATFLQLTDTLLVQSIHNQIFCDQ